LSVIFLGGALSLAFFGAVILFATNYGMTAPLEQGETQKDRKVTLTIMCFLAAFILVSSVNYIKLAYGL
jgi:hypothetical protein